LLGKAKAILARIEASQEPGGYVGVTDPNVRTDAQPLCGMDAYELYFLEHAFITAYQQWNDEKALGAAKGLADYFVSKIGHGKAEFWPCDLRSPENKGQLVDGHSQIAGHSGHYGWEGTQLIDPVLRLYEVTGDTKYLDWCKWVIANIDKWSGFDSFSRLDNVAAGKIGVHELQPYVHAHTFHMNFLGFLRMYQITGDASYLRKVEGAWRDIAARQMYITGGVSVGEHYEPGHNLPITGNVVETCATMSWIELSQRLLELTGDTKYADAIEKLLFNHLFAAQTVDGDSNRYHTPLNGTKPDPDGYFREPDCCTASGHRIIAKLPALIYASSPGVVFVNQYVQSKASVDIGDNVVNVTTNTEYPRAETIELVVSPAKEVEFEMKLRIPSWCSEASVKVAGKSIDSVKSGSYLSIKRRWRPGDKIEMTLLMVTRWLPGDHTTQGMCALTRGPVVYSLDTVWWDNAARGVLDRVPQDLSKDAAVDANYIPVECDAPARSLRPALKVLVVLKNGMRFEAKMLPFANTDQWYRPGEERPKSDSSPFAYALWLYDASGDAWKTLHKTPQ
jgi:DUF1680 family protein